MSRYLVSRSVSARWRPAALACAVAAGLLAGCGGGDPADAPASSSPPSEPTAALPEPAAALPEPEPVTPVGPPASPSVPAWTEYGGPYADAVIKAAERYAGPLEEAALDRDAAGPLLATILHGPLSAVAARPGTILPPEYSQTVEVIDYRFPNYTPATTDRSGFPGYPAAMLSRSGIGTSPWDDAFGWGFYNNSAAFDQRWQDVFSREAAGQQPCVEGGDVAWSADLDGAGAIDERSVTWNGCHQDGTVLDGSARLRRETLSSARQRLDIAWDDLVYTSDSRSVLVLGVESWPDGEGCGIDRPRVSNVLVEALEDGRQVYLDRFATSVIGGDEETRACLASGLRANHFIGRVLDSRYGAVRVDTPMHLVHTSMSVRHDFEGVRARDPDDPGKSHDGQLWLAGADDSEVRMSYESFDRFGVGSVDGYVKFASARSAVRVDVVPSDRAPETFRFHRIDARRGAMSDLRDGDGDGAPDAWETLAGLDPADGTDGAADGDGDGRSVAEEQRVLTTDDEPDVFELSSDHAIVLGGPLEGHVPQEFVDNGYSMPAGFESLRDSVSVRIPPGNRDLRPQRFRFSLSIDGDARFVSAQSYAYRQPFGSYGGSRRCSMSADGRRLDCDLPESRNCAGFSIRIGFYRCDPGGLAPMSFGIGGPPEAVVTVTARLEPGALDTEPSNDVATFVLP